MNGIFQPYLDNFLLIFIDDVIIYYKNWEEHENLLRIFLQTLWDNQLYAKYNKCDFYKGQIQYIGHVISVECITLDQKI